MYSLCASILAPQWSKDKLSIVKAMLYSPSAVAAALRMARDEMDQLKALDTATLQKESHRIYMYYAADDDWVGNEKKVVMEVLGPTDRVYDDPGDIPHAFCITDGKDSSPKSLVPIHRAYTAWTQNIQRGWPFNARSG